MDRCPFDIACQILRKNGCTVNSEVVDFFEIVGKHFVPEEVKSTECRLRIAEFILKNEFHFQVFLPANSQWTSNALADLTRDVSKKGKRPPSPREVFAAAELIEQEVHLLELKGRSQSDARIFHCPVFAPVLKARLGENDDENRTEPLVLLHVQNDSGFVTYAEVTGSLEALKSLTGLSNEKHKSCSIARFRNSFSTIFSESVYEENNTEHDLYRLISIVFYGNETYRDRVKDMVCRFESDEDHIDMTACLLDQNNEHKSKPKLVKKHVDELRSDTAVPYEPELFAIASIFNIPLFVDTIGDAKNWNLYMPLTDKYGNLYANPVMLQRGVRSKNFKYKLVNTCKGKCLCEQVRPAVKGKFAIFKDDLYKDIADRIVKESCCPTSKRPNKFHGHYKDIENSKTTLSPPVDYIQSPQEVSRIQTRRLDFEGRRIDQIGGGDGTIQQCLSKEIYGDESETKRIIEQIGDFDGDTMSYLQKASDWTRKSIYLLCANTEEDQHTWTALNPQDPGNKTCRYYITILLKKSGHFDRIIPKCGCNCELFPPLFDLEIGFSVCASKLNITKEARHQPLVTFLPADPAEDDFEEEKRTPPMYSPYSELRHVCKRDDMKDRYIDVSSDFTYSLYRCLSKEIFGTEKHFYSLVEFVMTEVKEHPKHYGRIYEPTSLSKIRKFFKFKSTIEKENAVFYANRIEDGLNLEDLELLAVATFFQTPIFVLSVNNDDISIWREFTQTRRKYKPPNLDDRLYKSKCEPGTYSITLFRTACGQYHRIVPRNKPCNCLLKNPICSKVHLETLYVRQNSDTIHFMNRCREIENLLMAVDIALENWNRSVVTLEAFCDGMIVDLENIRQNVNIASIVGSSVGFVGASLAFAGVISAPFTFGASLGLTIAGAVVGGAGGLTSLGSRVTEAVLNKRPIDQLKRRQMILKERSDELKTDLENLKEAVKGFFCDVNPPNLDDLHALEVQALPGVVRMIKAFTILPMMVLRSASRAAVICASIIGPLSALLDVGIIAYSAYNLHKGSRTAVTDNLRGLSVLLRSMRTQMQIWRYGTEERSKE